jgi:hypothetical protein
MVKENKSLRDELANIIQRHEKEMNELKESYELKLLEMKKVQTTNEEQIASLTTNILAMANAYSSLLF